MPSIADLDVSAFQNHVLYTTHELIVRQEANNSTSNPENATRPPIYKVVGLILAICSGLFIGVSFVVKKVGLLKANEKYHEEAGEGYGYLKNGWWWLGMGLMIVGEVCNFVAYAFTDAILVTPLGALSVVVTTILSAIFLKERLSMVGKVGCFMCIVGSIVIVLNAPEQSAVADIQQMKHFVIAPGFLTYAGVIILGSFFIAFWAGPRYGKKSMFVYLSICSFIGGLSVVATQGLGAAVIAQISKGNQFNQWFLYFLLVFVIATLLTEIVYLNKALNIFNAALVTPTYYVFFTSTTIITSAILFQGFHGTGVTIATVVMGFLQICAGVVLLQLSKSAKDVPDAAIFKGDLDQVREIVEQAHPESEPKADAIRGTASIIRRLSTPRRNLEQMEARRLREEKALDVLEPLKEDEVVEWDGLRRRKTIIGAGPTTASIARRKTIHPPLGMTHFPEENENEEEGGLERRGSTFITNVRERAQTLFPRPKQHHDSAPPEMGTQNPINPVAMTDIRFKSSDPDSPALPYGPGSLEEAQHRIYGHSMSELKTIPSPRSKPLPASPVPSEGLKAGSQSKRQFSFSNFMRSPKQSGHSSDHQSRPGTAASHAERKAHKAATEEERLGLSKGDSTRPLMADSSPEHQRDSTLTRSMSTESPESPVLAHGSFNYPQVHRTASPDTIPEVGESSTQRSYLHPSHIAPDGPSPMTATTPRNQSVSPSRQRPSPPAVYHPQPAARQDIRIPSLQPPSEPSIRRVTIGNPQGHLSVDAPYSRSTPSLAPPVQLLPPSRDRSREMSEISPGQSLVDVRLGDNQERGRSGATADEEPERGSDSNGGSRERYAEQSARERDERRARAQKRKSTGNNAQQGTDQS